METIILFAPLVGAIIAGFGWRIIGDQGAQYVSTALLFLGIALFFTLTSFGSPVTVGLCSAVWVLF